MLLAYVFAETISQLALSDILQFWTGADALPPCGFPSRLQLCFCSRGPDESHRLPSASTCALVLWLPRDVDDPEVMWQRLVDSVSLSAGFEKV